MATSDPISVLKQLNQSPAASTTAPSNTPPDPFAVLSQIQQEATDPMAVIAQLQAEATQPQVATAQPASIGEAFKAGVMQVGTALGATAEIAGKLPQLAPEGSWLHQTGEAVTGAGRTLREAATLATPQMMRLEDALATRDPVVIGTWARNAVIQQVPITLATLAGGGATAAVRASPLLGMLGSAFMLEGGSTYADLKDKGQPDKTAIPAAFGVGSVNALLEVVTPFMIGKSLFWAPKELLKKGAETGIGAVPKILAKTAVAEPTTEVLQETASIAGETWAGVPPSGAEILSRIFNVAAGGIVAGVAGGGSVDVITTLRKPKTIPGELSQGQEPAPPVQLPNVEPEPTEPRTPSLPGLVEQVDLTPIEVKLKQKILEKGPLVDLFGTFTGEGLRSRLGFEEDVPLGTFIEEGLIAQTPGGLYQFTDKVTGGRTGAFEPILEPEAGWEGGWWRDHITGNLYKDFDPSTGAFEDVIEKTPGMEGRVAGFTWTDTLGEKIFSENIKDLFTIMKQQEELLRMPKGWTVSLDKLSFTNGVQTIRTAPGDSIVPAVYRVYNPDGSEANLGAFRNPSEAALQAEEYNIWKERVHPFARDLVIEPETKTLGQKEFVGDTPQEYRRSLLYKAEQWDKALNGAARTAGNRAVFAESSQVSSTKLAQSPMIDQVLSLADTYIRVAISKIVSGEGSLLRNFPGLAYLQEAYEGLIYNQDRRSAGEFIYSKKDLSKFVISLEVFPYMQSPIDQSIYMSNILWHELAHAVAHGHADTRLAAEKEIARLMRRESKKLTRSLYAIYSPTGRGFGPGVRDLVQRFGYNPQQGIVTFEEADSAAGRPPSTTYPRGVGLSSTVGGVGGLREGAAGDEGGASAGGYFQADGPEFAGDYPPPAAGYQAAIEELRARSRGAGDQVPLDPIADEKAASIIKRFSKSLGMTGEHKEEMEGNVIRLNHLLRNWTTLIQFEKHFPHVPGLRVYRRMVELFAATKNQVVMAGDRVAVLWRKLGHGKLSSQLSDLIVVIREMSTEQERRLSDAEIIAKAASLGITDEKVLEVYWEIDKSLVDVMLRLKAAQLAENKALFGALSAPADRQTEREFSALLDRNYFPLSRFGRHGILVRALRKTEWEGKTFKKGQTVFFETWDWRRDRDANFHAVQEQFSGADFDVSTRYVESHEVPFVGFPPTLFNKLAAKLQLTKRQEIAAKELMYTMAPGQGFVKRLKRFRGVAGYSRDLQRAYADYMRHASNHVARATHRRGLEMALKSLLPARTGEPFAAGYQEIHEAMEQHYGDLMNPKNYSGIIGGSLFAWYFWGAPKQVVVNLTQIPIFTFPYLTQKMTALGGKVGEVDWQVAKELAKAATDAGRWLRKGEKGNLDPGLKQLISRAFEDGYMDESYASNLAAYQDYKGLTRFLPGTDADFVFRDFIRKGLYLFQMSEGFNRLQTFIAAVRLAESKGMDAEGQYQFAKDAVRSTQWEYASWNRPKVFRKLPAAFVFRSYLQHATHFAVTGQGGWRFWAMMAVFAGINGVPFAENLLDLLTGVSSFVAAKTGWSNWRVDAETEIRKLVADFGANPDAVMNGIARYSLGMTGLERLFGLPFPTMDLSASVGLGRIIPGTEPFSRAIAGTQDIKTALYDTAMQVAGTAGTTGMNLLQAVADPSVEGTRFLKYAPAVIKNVSRAWDYLTKGAYVNAQGEPLVSFDATDPVHLLEILGQALGATPTRITAKLEGLAAENQERTYWLGRREWILSAYALAVGTGTTEAVADVTKRFLAFQEDAPSEVKMKAPDLVQSIRDRVKGQNLRVLGLPQQRRYFELTQEYQRAYPSPQ